MVSQIGAFALRRIRPVLRRPVSILISMFQSIVWLLLFGGLFSGFGGAEGIGGSYITFLLPGVVMMNGLYVGIYLGMGLLGDLQAGVLERFLVSPVRRVTILLGDLCYLTVLLLTQYLLLIVLGAAVGVPLTVGLLGMLPVGLAFGMSVGCVSLAAALLTGRHEAMISVMQFGTLPLMFLSTAFLSREEMPAWMASVSRFNPLDWAISAGRALMLGGECLLPLLGVAGLLAACLGFALFSFRVYQKRL